MLGQPCACPRHNLWPGAVRGMIRGPMARARPGSSVDYQSLPTEALNPRSEMLDTLPADQVVKLMLEEEANAVKAVRARADEIAAAARLVADRLAAGGRVVYVGAGT